MDPKLLINSAEVHLNELQDAEFTPKAELAQLELQLAIAKCVYAIAEYIAPLQLKKGA